MAVPKTEVEQRMRRFEEVCRAGGLKVTHQRSEIFRVLARTDEHPDADTVYKRVHRRMPAVSLDTVYRTLATLEEVGLISKAEVHSPAARYDANTRAHHHFVCTECGRVQDIYSDKMDNLPVPPAVRKVGTVSSRHVQLRDDGCRARL